MVGLPAKQRINLIPIQLQIASEINFRKLFTIWVLLVLVALLGIYAAQKARVLQYQNKMVSQNGESQLLLQQKADLDQKVAGFWSQLRNRDELKQRGNIAKQILSNYTFPSTILMELSIAIPSEVWVTELSLAIQTERVEVKMAPNRRRVLAIEGFALNQEAIGELLTNLESHVWFKDVQLRLAEREEDSYQNEVFSFQMEARLEEGKREN